MLIHAQVRSSNKGMIWTADGAPPCVCLHLRLAEGGSEIFRWAGKIRPITLTNGNLLCATSKGQLAACWHNANGNAGLAVREENGLNQGKRFQGPELVTLPPHLRP